MSLVLGIIIGAIYGRNARVINQRLYEDICHIAVMVSKTQLAVTGYYLLETIVMVLERKLQPQTYTHDLLCTCNRRSCKPVSINTYVRKLKAVQ